MDNDAIREEKKALRAQMGARRDALMPSAREQADRAIRERTLALPEWATARTLFVYVSFRTEVDTRALIDAALASGRRVLAPRVDRSRREMDACAITAQADLVPGTWGILEPRPDIAPADPAGVDLVLTPGLAFDSEGGRLGYGAGFYDRYFRCVRPDCARVGLAYDVQIVPAVPGDAEDERVNLVVTETRVLRASVT